MGQIYEAARVAPDPAHKICITSKTLKWVGAGLLLALVIAFIGYLVGSDRGQSSRSGITTKLPPVEFLYLDSTRVLSYLSELEGGEPSPIKQISTEIRKLEGSISASSFKVAANSQHESVAESTLTRTEASLLGLLLRDLAEDTERGVAVHDVDLGEPQSVDRVKEGELVKFSTSDLVGPNYIRPYVVVRESATLPALFPKAAGHPTTAERAKRQRRKARVFVNEIGPNPRITFEVSAPTKATTHETKPPTVLLPMQYSDLTLERSLLEKDPERHTGGKLVVIGKVIRDFSCQGGEPSCAESPEYTDFATRETWHNPLKLASDFLICQVSHGCKEENESGAKEESAASGGGEPVAAKNARRAFIKNLEGQTALSAPGLVILPIAIYK